jgi:hypothetical protein
LRSGLGNPSGRAICAGERKSDQKRHDRGSNGSVRWSALWGKPSKGETRSSALWGKGGRGFLATLALATAFAVPAGALAGGSDEGNYGRQLHAFVPAELEQAARANPGRIFPVIVQSRGSAGAAAKEVDEAADATVTTATPSSGASRRWGPSRPS